MMNVVSPPLGDTAHWLPHQDDDDDILELQQQQQQQQQPSSNLPVRSSSSGSLAAQLQLSPIRSADTTPVNTETASETATTISADTMNRHAERATELLQAGEYQAALKEYQTACDVYSKSLSSPQTTTTTTTLLDTCNVAACWRNIGGVQARHLQHYEQAIVAWNEAARLYQASMEEGLLVAARQQQQKQQQQQPVDNNDMSTMESFCIDALWMETLQGRAALHFRYQENPIAAMECHEQVVRRLLALSSPSSSSSSSTQATGDATDVPLPTPDNTTNASDNSDDSTWDPQQLAAAKIPIVQDGVCFRPLTQEEHTQFLILSLESLGTLYKRAGDRDDGIAAFQEALDIVRKRYEEEEKLHGDAESVGQLLDSMTKILRALSEIYFERGDVDRAVDALHDVMDIKLSRAELPSDEAMEAMEKMGQANEQMENYDKALACYEKALLARSRCLGEDHIDIAKSLINVARVMELQGNAEGSMDLYRAAQAIYAKQVTSRSFDVEGEDIVTILQLVPGILEQGRYEEAVAYLNKCLEAAEADDAGIDLDKSQIFYDLGKAYIGLEDYVPATICLVEAAKEEGGKVSEEEVVALLQHVEYLQRGGSISHSASSHTGTSEESSTAQSSHAKTRARPLDNAIILRHSASGRRDSATKKRSSHRKRGSSTPVTWEGLSACESKSAENVSKRNDSMHTDADGEESTEDEGTAYYDSESEAGIARIPRSDVSSSEENDDISFSDDVSPPITIDPIPQEDESERNTSPEKSSRTSSSPRRRRNNVFKEKFKRKRKGGFECLEDDDDLDQKGFDALPPEDDYHSYATFDGPIQFIDITSPSWDSGVSQITLRFEDPNSSRDTSQEWWWGVTSKGLGRWFPSKYVNQAVEAAEGFLSAKAIHEQKRPEADAFVLSDEDEEEEEDGSMNDLGSLVDADHPTNVGIATSRATRDVNLLKEQKNKQRNSEPTQTSPKLESLFSCPRPRQQKPSTDLTSEIADCRERLETQQLELGKSHPEVALTLFSLAMLQSRCQDTIAALESATEALQIQKLNGSSDDALRSLHFLGDLHLHQKTFTSALTLYAEALKLERSRYGEYSDQTAKTLNCIGNVRSLQGEFALAMESHQEALTILKDCYGEDPKHPLVADTLCQIGSVYYRERNSLGSIKAKSDGYSTFIESGMLEVIGRAHEDRGSYKMAIGFFEEKLQFLENRGKTQADMEETATTLNSLGMLCTRAGLYSEAIDYYERALSMQLQLGCDEVDLATARVLTAAVQYQLGHWKNAIALLEDALGVLQRELGEEHETVAATLFQTGVVRAALCEHDLAMEALKNALTMQVKLLGGEHPASLRTHREIGKMYSIYESELDSAFEIFNDVLEAQKAIHGEKHPNICDTLHCIGCAYSTKGDFSNALRFLEQCYYMRLEFLGWDHPLQATTLHEIANIHLGRHRIEKASRICDVVLRIRSESLTDKHVDVARTLALKGKCLTAKGDFAGAEQCLLAARAMCEEAVGGDHPIAGDIHTEIGILHLRKCQFDEARREIQTGISIYNAKLDQDHPSILEAAQKLQRVERDEMLCV